MDYGSSAEVGVKTCLAVCHSELARQILFETNGPTLGLNSPLQEFSRTISKFTISIIRALSKARLSIAWEVK